MKEKKGGMKVRRKKKKSEMMVGRTSDKKGEEVNQIME